MKLFDITKVFVTAIRAKRKIALPIFSTTSRKKNAKRHNMLTGYSVLYKS